MKISLALFNSLGFTSPAQIAWFTANVLSVATATSPIVKITPAVTAVIGKRAIPAFAGITAKPALTIAQNTTGFAAGERSSGRPAVAAQAARGGYAAVAAIPAIPASPAYAIGVAVPAIAAVPARAAQAEVIPVTAVAAVDSPAITPVTGWDAAIDCEVISDTALKVTAYVPYASGSKLIGSSVKGVGNVLEMTPAALEVKQWLDGVASLTFTTLTSIPTLERILYQAALDLVALDPVANTIEQVLYTVAGKPSPCHKITLNLSATAYDVLSESIQLDKVAATAIVPNSFTVGQVISVPTMNYSGMGWVVNDGGAFNAAVDNGQPFPYDPPVTLISSY